MATAVLTDEQIQRDVLAELKYDVRVGPSEIGVIVKDGVVALTGWVDSYTKKWSAVEAAQRVHGVKAVADEIEVRLPSTAQRTDPDIAAAARHALESDASLATEHIDITVAKGIVTLKGEVEWHYQKEEAERAVRWLAGVRGVVNLLTVRPRHEPAPTELKQEIEQALVRSAELDARQIQVETRGSTVILRGTVRSRAERQEAERVAWLGKGVTAVENHITIKPA